MGTLERGRIARGALSGLIATGPMTAALLAAVRLGLLDELPPTRIVERLLPGLSAPSTRVLAAAAHVVYGAGAGVALAVAAPPRGRRATVGYALLVWFLGYEGWVPVAGVLPPAHRDRRGRAASILVAHVVYGLALRVPRR